MAQVAPAFAVVRSLTPADGPSIGAWIVETWFHHQSRRQYPRSRDVIRHLLQRPSVQVRIAVPACDPSPDPDAAPFGWAAVEPWADGSTTVHFVYVRGRVPERNGEPPSPGLRGYGLGHALVAGLSGPVWYTTTCRLAIVPAGWRYDPWR